MARFYKVSVGGIWLTDDRTEDGRPCKVEIPNPGLAMLTRPNAGRVTVASDGASFREVPLTPTGGGRTFQLIISWIDKSVYEDLAEVLDDSVEGGTFDAFQVTGEGTPGDFDVQAKVFDNPDYIRAESFSGDTIKRVVVNLITDSFN